MLPRNIRPAIETALADTPVVFVAGPRQAGKTTLVRELAASRGATYLSLDDAGVLAAAAGDPAGFVSGAAGPLVLDEVQRAPQLFRAIKTAVDADRRAGRFLLTGSASLMVLPQLADSLAGRMEPLTLWPFSQGELERRSESFVETLFARNLPALAHPRAAGERQLWSRVLTGGFPEAVARDSTARRRAWMDAYLTTVLQREVRDLSNVEDLGAMPRVLALAAARGAGLLNASALSRESGIPHMTLRRYLTLFEGTFLTRLVPAWSRNIGKRMAKAAKLFVTDTGLMSALLSFDAERLKAAPVQRGPLLETFVAMELLKQIGWSRRPMKLYHFRTHAGSEVDLVLEEEDGGVVGIEVKAAATVGTRDFAGLRALAEAAGADWVRGVVLYTGADVIPFGAQQHAVPVRALWSW